MGATTTGAQPSTCALRSASASPAESGISPYTSSRLSARMSEANTMCNDPTAPHAMQTTLRVPLETASPKTLQGGQQGRKVLRRRSHHHMVQRPGRP